MVRGASKDLMSTFTESTKALVEGDNILLFPEKPRELNLLDEGENFDSDKLRSFYTGFAHLGKMYYKQTGKALLFYPLYTSKEDRAFAIGEAVAYDPGLDSRESKRVLADELFKRMEKLSSTT